MGNPIISLEKKKEQGPLWGHFEVRCFVCGITLGTVSPVGCLHSKHYRAIVGTVPFTTDSTRSHMQDS